MAPASEKPWRLLLAGLALLAAATGPAPSPAAPPRNAAANLEAPGSDVAAWVRDLHSLTFRTRDDATTALLRLPVTRMPEILAAFRIETDDEAAARLLRVAIHLYLRAQTPMEGDIGMLGIALAIETVQLPGHADLSGAVAVTELQPGFPAEEYLKSGDRLVALNGEPFPADLEVTTFRERVNSTPPGSLLRFTVIRNGRTLALSVPLAGVPSNLPLANFVDNRRESCARFVDSIKPAAVPAASPLVLPDADSSGELRIQLAPVQILNPPDPILVPQPIQPNLVGPPGMIDR